MRKCLIAIAILLIPIAVFSQEKGIQSTKKYILASFHYSPSGSGMLYFNNGAEGIGGSVKYGLEFPIASSSFHLETGAGVGVLASRNYTPQFFYPEELESELYPYFYVPLGVNYKIKVKVGDEDYVHIKVFVPLPCNSTEKQLMSQEEGKKLNDAL